MRTGLPVTMLSLVAAVALSFALVKWSTPKESAPINRGAEAADYEYLLKDYRGRLAVFHRGAADPDLVFDVYIQSLPDYDRGQLKNGVSAKDYAELVNLIEDYTS